MEIINSGVREAENTRMKPGDMTILLKSGAPIIVAPPDQSRNCDEESGHAVHDDWFRTAISTSYGRR